MIFNLTTFQILLVAFLFLTTFNCLITYFCSSSSLKIYEKTKSFAKGIERIRIFDKYLLTLLTLVTSIIYIVLSYFFFVELLIVSDYFITLSILLGFILSLFTTFFSRLCYCYACNILLKTKLNEYECFIENLLYLVKVFFPLFLISFIIPTIYLIPIVDVVRRFIIGVFIFIYLIIWITTTPGRVKLIYKARKIKGIELKETLTQLFKDNKIKHFELYYWDSSKTNEANAFISGFTKRYLFISSTLIELITKEELKAVVLHEIGHLKRHHFSKLLISKLLIFSIVSAVLYYIFILKNINIWLVFGLIFVCILTMSINLKDSRKFEDEADFFVNEKGYGKELVSALKKISYGDLESNKFDQWFSDHPDIKSRITKINHEDDE